MDKKKSDEDVFFEICSFCGKEISGKTEDQVKYLLMQHILSKHPEKIKVIK